MQVFNHFIYHHNIQCSSTQFQSPAASRQLFVTFFCLTKPIKKLDLDLTQVNKTDKAQLVISWRFIADISKVRVHYAMSISLNPCVQRKGNRQILLNISRLFKQNLALPLYQNYAHLLMIQQRQRSDDLSPKCFYWTSKQPFTIHFFLASCNVFPDSRYLCTNTRIRLLATH